MSIIHKNQALTYTLLVFFMVMGISAYQRMPRNSMPPFKVRFASVVTFFPGAGPERVENLVTSKIEEVIQEIPEVKYIFSESRTGISVVSVAIKDSENDLQPIFDKIRRKVEKVEGSLPADAGTPNINDEKGEVFGILVGITAGGYTYAELKEVADSVRDALIKLEDAAQVTIAGTQEEQIFIDYDNARLAELGLTMTQIQGTLAAINIIYPGGDVMLGHERIILEPSGNFESIRDLQRTLISAGSGGQPLFLGDVTSIYRGYIDPPSNLVRVNGKDGLVLGISLKSGGNIIDLGLQVDAELAKLERQFPHGVSFDRIASLDRVVEKSVEDFLSNLIQSVVVVLLVMLLFLGMRTGMVVASLIPMAIIMGLMGMDMLDVGLDKVSLAALILALGMLVDNAIVVSEAIMVRMGAGEPALDAATAAVGELAVPLLVSTLTTSAAFLPFYLAESTMGEIVGPIFLVITAVLLSSWILALTIIPLLCIRFLVVKPQTEDFSGPLRSIYRRILHLSLRFPKLFLLLLFGVFVAAIMGMKFVPSLFMPNDDRALVYANLELPSGTSIERTRDVALAFEKHLGDSLLVGEGREKGVLRWSTFIGEPAPKYDLGYSGAQGSTNAAHMLFITTSDAANDLVIEGFEGWAPDRFPELKLKVSRLTSGGGSEYPIGIRFSGKDLDKLFRIVADVKAQLRAGGGVKEVVDDWGPRTKKLVVEVDQVKAQLAGITNQDLAISLQTVLNGLQASEFREGDIVVPIVMRHGRESRMDISALESLDVYSQSTGANVPLKQIADIRVSWQYSKILRRDLYRTVTVNADTLAGVTADQVTSRLKPWLVEASKSWGTDYQYELGGEAESKNEAMEAVAVNMPLAFFAVALLLIGQFNSFRRPFIVLATIPLGFIGVVVGLLIGQSYFGFFTFLGIVSLAGIVINNAIVLLDRIQLEQVEYGRNPGQAIVHAAQQRLRPIMLTTATTALGLVPLWWGGGPMFEPMALAIMFGLLFATVITLLFVPVLYMMLYRVDYTQIAEDRS
ncbi:efflux RND transporter permease subunit [Sulfidibacter corallicola]|uniref:Efflux RND transporter permease subunit n=1 Tax=Sulfidibacter corallicola TaxID=2818388 RepID=A0A8A4TSC6_SULCO|nr:efflux RND transporter permease subunit [Sulfidibacter corallicola]QTD52054.1 efflux RND transporter permease subunit [Sulfidibacter corallicola]